MAVAQDERMRIAAGKQRTDVLNTEDRCLQRDLSTLLGSADIYWRGISEESKESLQREVDAFEVALEDAGVRAVPRLCDSLGQALRRGNNQELTLKFEQGQFDAAQDDLREAVLGLTTWSPGAPPATVFAEDGARTTVTDAAERLCLICVPRAGLAEQQRARTFDVLHLLAPQLSTGRLDTVEHCLRQVESGRHFEAALRPGLTGADHLGVVPVWPDPESRRQRWVVAAGRSWVFASPVDEVTSDDADRVARHMVPRWERAALPDHGAALGSVLVETAIGSAARRAQALGRVAEGIFPLEKEAEIRAALDRLAMDLAELNAGLDELEVAAADARTDLERKLVSLPGGSDDAELYRSLRASLEEALAKLDRQQQRLQGSFLAAREHASSHHVAETVNELRRHQETIFQNQRATDELNTVVGRLTIMLLGPTIVFGALSVTDYWIPHTEYATSLALLFVYVIAGFAVSLFIRSRIHFFTRLFAPRASASAVERPTPTSSE